MTTNHHTAIGPADCYNKSDDINSRLSDLDSAISTNAQNISGKADIDHGHNLADLIEKNYSSLDGAPNDDNMHALTAETTIASDDELLIYDLSATAYRKITWSDLTSGLSGGSSAPYDIGGTFSGPPTDGLVLLRYPLPRAVTFPASLTASKMIAGTAATASSVFSLKKNGTEFGTATFAAAGTSATFAATSETSFSAGDVLTIVGPGTADATLADLGWAIVGER